MDGAAPPPYTLRDTHRASHSSTQGSGSVPPYENGTMSQTSLRGGYIRREDLSEEQPRYPSAASYFEERPCTIQHPSFVLKCPLVIDAGATMMDVGFPQPERDYQARDVRGVDWHTFLNCLLPDVPSDSKHSNERHNHGGHTDPRGQSRIRSVINEWNEGFFNPRGILIQYEPIASYASSSRMATSEIPITFNTSGSQPPTVDPRLRAPNNGLPTSDPGYPYGSPRHEEQYSRRRSPQRKHHSRGRSSSSSSSSSFSSSSSDSSINSISSKDLNGLDHSQVQQAMATFRVSAPTTSLSSAVGQLKAQLRAQRHTGGIPNRGVNMVSSAQLRAESRRLQAQIRDEVRAMKRTRKEQGRARRQTKRETKRERRGIERELKYERRELRRETKAAYRDAKRERKAEKKAKKHGAGFRGVGLSRGVDDVARGVQQMGMGRAQDGVPRGQETGVVGNIEGMVRGSQSV